MPRGAECDPLAGHRRVWHLGVVSRDESGHVDQQRRRGGLARQGTCFHLRIDSTVHSVPAEARNLAFTYHAQAYSEPALWIGPGVFDFETAATHHVFQTLDRVFIAIFRMNAFALGK